MLDIIYACCLQNIVLLSNRTLRSFDSMKGSAGYALFLRSSASNILLPELTNCASPGTDDYTHMSQQEDEWESYFPNPASSDAPSARADQSKSPRPFDIAD